MTEELRVKREITIVNQILEVRDCSDWDTNFLTGVREQLQKNRELTIKQRGIMFDYLMDTAKKVGHIVAVRQEDASYKKHNVEGYTEGGLPILRGVQKNNHHAIPCFIYLGKMYQPASKRITHQYARAEYPGAMTATGVTGQLTEEEAKNNPYAMEQLPWTERITYVDAEGEEVTR